MCSAAERRVHLAFREIPVVRCRGCGFLYSARLMAPEALREYYRDGFGSERHRRGQIVNARVNARVVRRLLRGRPIRTALDVGTGYGFLLHLLQAALGVRVVGVELSRQEAAYGRSALGLDIRNAPLAEAGLAPGAFDLVSCFEVVEHVPDPPEFVRQLVEHVAPGGYLLVMTDNFESAVARGLGAAFPKWIPHAHVSHFGPASLERLLSAAPLAVVDRFSFSPWELSARLVYHRLRGIERAPAAAFDLERSLATEMLGRYPLFGVRRSIDPAWARLTGKGDLDGALMYCLARRESD